MKEQRCLHLLAFIGCERGAMKSMAPPISNESNPLSIFMLFHSSYFIAREQNSVGEKLNWNFCNMQDAAEIYTDSLGMREM
jgi:hypothetical protein